MTLNHVRLLYRCIYAHPQTACLALCLAQISFTCGEANISRSVNLMHYRAIWSDTYFQWEFTFIISAWPKVWATPTAKICKHSMERKSPTKYRYPTRWRTLYKKRMNEKKSSWSAITSTSAITSAGEVIVKCNNISSFMECKNIFS